MKTLLTDKENFKIDAKKLSLKEMAKRYNMKPCTVSKWKNKLNIITVPKNIPLPNKEKFTKEVQLYPNVVLAEKYGVGLKLISKWRKKLGLTNIWHKEGINWEEFDKDVTIMRWYQLTHKYSASWSVIKNWKKERGLTTGKKENRRVTWIELKNGCWISTSHVLNDKGYSTCKEGLVAMQMWSEKNGKWPTEMYCLHSCDEPACINPDHVHPGTQKQNQAEMKERNRSPWGMRSGARKLSATEAKKIYSLKDSGLSTIEVGKKFNISASNVRCIWNGVTWWRDIQGIKNFDLFLTTGEKIK